MQHHEESPFHAVGFALVAYVEAMLSFETEKILTALERIASAELLARQFAKKAKRRHWHNRKEEEYLDEKQPNKKLKSPEIQYELLATNCMIMSSTIQFLRNSWLEYMKAAYKLRKAYKLYEQMFESLTGQKASDYASILRSSGQTPFDQVNNDLSLSVLIAHSTHVKGSWNDKRISLFNIPPNQREKLKPRPMSTLDITCSVESMPSSCDSFHVIDNAIESGIFFGIGLFSLIFSLLPPRGKTSNNDYNVHTANIISCSEQDTKYPRISFFPTICTSFVTTII